MPRLWLVFFGQCRATAWWARVFRPGWRHVAAAAYFPSADRWLYVDPVAPGLSIEIATPDDFHARYQDLMTCSTAVLRFASQHERGAMPATFYCVGAIKAVLGIRSRALSPRALYDDLVARGAEIRKAPGEVPIVQPAPETGAAVIS